MGVGPVSWRCEGEPLSSKPELSHVPDERWRQIFAEAQVPYDKIMGCAEFCAVRAASRRKIGCAAVALSTSNARALEAWGSASRSSDFLKIVLGGKQRIPAFLDASNRRYGRRVLVRYRFFLSHALEPQYPLQYRYHGTPVTGPRQLRSCGTSSEVPDRVGLH